MSSLSTPGSEAWAEQFAATLQAERERAREFLGAQLARLERAESVVEQQIERLEQELQGHCGEVGRLHDERDALAARLVEAEAQLQAAEERAMEQSRGYADGRNQYADEDEQRRYELAMDDIRQLKVRNNELQQQLDKARSTAMGGTRQSRQPGTLDWEAEKQNILAALEASSDEEDDAERDNRQQVADVLQTTTAVVAEKDREINSLKQRLEELEGKAETESARADISEVLDSDALVQEERNRLKRLQEEWRDKLRQAEVEIALERAKLARQRAEIESKHHSTDDTSRKTSETAATGQAEGSSIHGRWLARLGLTGEDLVPGKHL